MTRYIIFIGLLMVSVARGYSQEFGKKVQLPTDKFFKQIVGSWKLSNRSIIEQWTVSTSGVYQARVLKLQAGDSTLTETIRVGQEQGQIYYEAKVLNQNEGKPIRFKLIKRHKKKVKFANTTHDFPQFIEYKLVNKHTLKVEISGMVRKKLRKVHFEYRKIKK